MVFINNVRIVIVNSEAKKAGDDSPTGFENHEMVQRITGKRSQR